jgi:hypothetical protein
MHCYSHHTDVPDNSDVKSYYERLRGLWETMIQEQYKSGKQLKIDTLFRPVKSAPPHV